MAKFFAWLLLIATTTAFVSSFCVENNLISYENSYEKQYAEMRQPLPGFQNIQFCDTRDPDDN